MNMIPTHLVPLEPAARILCELRGDNPDEQIPAEHPLGLKVKYSVPLWHLAAEQLHSLNEMLVALKRASQLTVVQPSTGGSFGPG